jgi:hypothetical protein
VDLETIPRQQSQSHTPNHETGINTLQTVNQRPSQFNTTEMNHGNHGAIIQTSYFGIFNFFLALKRSQKQKTLNL